MATGTTTAAAAATATATAAMVVAPVASNPCAGGSDTKQPSKTAAAKKAVVFGDGVPFGDPYWYDSSLASPYYNDTHRAFRAKVRAFVDAELVPYVHDWDETGTYPADLHAKAYAAGIYGAIWPKQYGGTAPEGTTGADMFHDLIMIDELARCGAGGVLWACFFSFGIALPPVIAVGSQYLKDLVARDVISGKKIMSLAVTEPTNGSDVAGLQTTAVRDGDHFVVNGLKKFITSGTKAHYFTTAVRTGGKGMGGVSLLLIEAEREGVRVTRMKTQGWWISGTALVAFDNVRVPVKNLIGQENDGFKAIMSNFNHERFVLAALSNRHARTCLEDAITYSRKRVTFGKRLIEHPVIRHKCADMAYRIESAHAMLEQVAYQMQNGAQQNAPAKLAAAIAMTKVLCTRTFDFCAREASQVLGGASCVRGGPGERIERLYREVRINAIGGGSEEILLDLAARQSKL